MKTLTKTLASAVLAASSFALSAGERVGDFSLIDQQGVFHHMAWYNDHKAVVIIPQSNGSADTASNGAALQALAEKYSQDVAFFMMNPGLQTDRVAVQADLDSHDLDFPVMMDDAQLVTELLALTSLDQAVVYNPSNFELVYRGPVADSLELSLLALINGENDDFVEVASNGATINSISSHGELSYEKDIAPILAENCASCHRDGGIAPFALDSHLAVQGWSPMIKEVVMTKRMPPGQIDNKVGRKFLNEMNLSDEEMQKLIHWVDAGSKVDSDNDPLTALVWPETKWRLGEPDLIIQVPPQTIPATGVVDYKDIPLELGLDQDRWIRGSEVVPGETAVLHHIITTVVPPEGPVDPQQAFMSILNSIDEEAAAAIRQKLFAVALSGEELGLTDILEMLPPEADLSSLISGTDDPNAASIAGYAPGTLNELNEPGVGGLLKAGSSLSLQMHYTTSGKEMTDATEIGIYFYPEGEVPTQRMSSAVGNNFSIKIPAGAKDHQMETTVTIKEDTYMETLMAHMHFRGKRMKFTAKYPDGNEELILSIPNYSFNWQLSHRLVEPLLLPAGTQIVAVGAYDNSTQNTFNPDPSIDIQWGEQSWEEMFMGFYDLKNVDQAGSE